MLEIIIRVFVVWLFFSSEDSGGKKVCLKNTEESSVGGTAAIA